MTEGDRALLDKTAREQAEKLLSHYEPGFGVFPSAYPSENFYRQVWTRDFAHAARNYFAVHLPEAVKDSLETIFRHQRADGALPLRIEKEYLILKLIPGLRRLARPIFEMVEYRIRGRRERPVFEGQDFSSGEDTVPAAIVAAGEFFLSSPLGEKFAEENFNKFKRAIAYFETKVDAEDHLVVAKYRNPDWADSIIRGGKLGSLNVNYARALWCMSYMAAHLNRPDDAAKYEKMFSQVNESIMAKLYDYQGAYFRAEEGVDRVDTVASVFGSLYLLPPVECVRVQETFKKRVVEDSGLKNFDPPYLRDQIMWQFKLIGHGGYHTLYVWPWVTCQNIQVKIKIALKHPSIGVREAYKREAVEDLLDMAHLFEGAQGAYEIFHPQSRKPAITRWYTPPQHFLANLVAFEAAYHRLRDLGWLD
jgi:glycogen debranching enzyme